MGIEEYCFMEKVREMNFRQQAYYSYYKKLCEFRGATLLDIHSPDWFDHWNELKREEIRNSKKNKPFIEEESKKPGFDSQELIDRIKLEAYFDVILDQLDHMIPKVMRLDDPDLDIDLLRHGISIILDFKYKIGSGG